MNTPKYLDPAWRYVPVAQMTPTYLTEKFVEYRKEQMKEAKPKVQQLRKKS